MRELNLLQELEKNPIVSQRELSNKFGIALGITNACLKSMAKRGWIIFKQANRKMGYYLTRKWLNEKIKLTTHFLSHTVKHYVELKTIFEHKFLEMERKGIRRIIFFGIGDEMEVAYITTQGTHMELIGIVEDDENWRPIKIFGFELRKLDEITEMDLDAVFITSSKDIMGPRLRRLENLLSFKKKVLIQHL